MDLSQLSPPHRGRAIVLLAGSFALFVACDRACAEGLSVGIGGGADRGKVDCVASFACDHDSGAVKVFLGYHWTDAVELRALYFDAGHFDGGDITTLGTPFGGTFKVAGFGLSAGYRWQLGQGWSAVARGGVAGVRTRFDYADDLAGSVSKTMVEPLGGLGVDYAITPQWRLGIDYDVTRFKVYHTQGSLQLLGVAADYSF